MFNSKTYIISTVCKQIVHEITTAVINEDPKKKIQVGSFRIQPDGSQKQTQVSIKFLWSVWFFQ